MLISRCTIPLARDMMNAAKLLHRCFRDILGEHIAVKSRSAPEKNGEPTMVVFGSAKAFEVETGVAGAAKGGDLLSGDSFSMVELGNGKFAVAISDGMGNGERARQESSAALSILQQLLQVGHGREARDQIGQFRAAASVLR